MQLNRPELRKRFSNLREFNPAAREEAKSRLNSLSRPDKLSELIDSIIQNESWLDDIAQRSYTHDNGFDKLVLIKYDNPERKLRLHAWDPSLIPQSPSEANIHNHRWNFCSSVLCGSLQFDIFEQENGKNEFYKYKYTPVDSTNEYSLEEKGTQNLIKKFSGNFSDRTNYSIEYSVIHRTYVSTEEPTATLMIQGPERMPDTSVFTTEPINNPDSMNVNKMSKREIKSRLEEILEWI